MGSPRVLSRIGPVARPSTARSIARPTAGREWEKDGLAAFADDAQHAVAVFLAEIRDRHAGGFEDPQPKQAEQADQSEVAAVR
jgi:hypothetical protein